MSADTNQTLVAPDSYRIVFLNSDRNWFDSIERAFQADSLYAALSLPQDHKTSGSSSSKLIELIHAEEWAHVEHTIMGGKDAHQPFSLAVVEVRIEEWELSQRMIERIWEIDASLHWVLCLPQDAQHWPSKVVLSRPMQWMMLRTPFLEEELIQVVWISAGNMVRNVRWGFVEDCPKEDENSSSSPSNLQDDLPPVDERQVRLELAREELATSKVYVDNILRSMADSLLVISADLTIGAVNPSLLELLGYQERDLIGQSPGCIFGDEFARGAIMEHLMLQGSVSGVESSFLTRDGQSIPITVSGSLMQDEQGQFQGMVCVAQDITDRKRMEDDQQKLHEQLLDTSRQLGMAEVASDVLHNVGNVLNSINVSIGVIKDLLNRSMVVDVKRVSQLLEKHGEDLGTFFTDNSKGTQVPSYLKKLSEQLLEEKRLALLEMDRLRENTEQAQHCVSAQLELAKPSELTEAISLNDLMDEAVNRHQGLIGKFSISVVKEWQELPQLLIDKHQLLQIVSDVIENACQAMETVELRTLTLRVMQVNGPPDSVRIEIQDTGSGIPVEDLTRIFSQGYTTKEQGRGSSLHSGALNAKNLGGALTAQSTGRGCGAMFSLDLPGNFHFPDL